MCNFLKRLTFIAILFASISLFAQNSAINKELSITKTVASIDIDGVLDEKDWQNASTANNFSNYFPDPREISAQTTTVKVLNDHEGIYIGAVMNDADPKLILKELTQRDEVGNTDWFSVLIDTYQDGIHAVEFKVTASGIQIDSKVTNTSNFDPKWNAVWKSAVKITKDGWVCEMMIPYAALRYKTKPNQNWNINFFRAIGRTGELSSWNPIQPAISGIVNQSGILSNISIEQSRPRIHLNPYLYSTSKKQTIANESEKVTNLAIGGDVKFGINSAFTVDMNLMPDVGIEIKEDILKFVPFGKDFKGTSYFNSESSDNNNNKNIFFDYIGDNYYLIENRIPGIIIESNPKFSRLINAVNINGRFNNGLGVNIFNSITDVSEARVVNLSTLKTEIKGVYSMANYNSISVDQNLKNNSSISIFNNNLKRGGNNSDFNSTGLKFNLNSKKNMYSLFGLANLSNSKTNNTIDYFESYNLGIAKISGNWTWQSNYLIDNNLFNFQKNSNIKYEYLFNEVSFTDYTPKINVNRWSASIAALLGIDNWFSRNKIAASFNVLTKFYWNISLRYSMSPFELSSLNLTNISKYKNNDFSVEIISDIRKKIYIKYEFLMRNYKNEYKSKDIELKVNPHFQVNNRLSFDYNFYLYIYSNYLEYKYVVVDFKDLNYIELNKKEEYNQVLKVKYTINKNLNFQLYFKNNINFLTPIQSFNYASNGELKPNNQFALKNDKSNFNDIGLNLFYRFAPGSDLTINYQHMINDFGLIFKSNVLNQNLNLKISYWLDYQSVREKMLYH
ncbi:MAG: carbohydrate binding family 9 domain-containing protein [Saprospiraceae bacterium]|nr:carbohydrate binding family 9 domain-containing protein [Saprospiraceae bacterium]